MTFTLKVFQVNPRGKDLHIRLKGSGADFDIVLPDTKMDDSPLKKDQSVDVQVMAIVEAKTKK